jgi:hypothetical protein
LGVGTLSATNTAGKIHARADGDEPKSLLVLQNRNAGGSAAVQLAFINGGVDYADDRYSYIRSIVTGAGQNGNNLTFATNPNGGAAQERLRITSDGKLGLGTSSPKNLLHVNGTVNLGNPTQNQTSNNIILVDAQSDPADTNKAAINLGTTAGASSSDSFISFFTNKYGVSRAERVRIDPEGRVGIGTTSPGESLEVSGNIRVSSNSGSFRVIGAADSSNTTVVLQAGATSGTGGNIELARNGDVVYDGANHRFRNVSGASEYARIDSSGRLLVGTSSNRTGAALQIEGTTFGTSLGTITNNSANSAPAYFQLIKSRGTSVGSQALVSNGDGLGNVQFVGTDGTQQLVAAAIEGIVDGTPGTNDMPGRLVFSTTADGASSPTERFRLGSDGSLRYAQATTATPGEGNTTTGISFTVDGTVSASRASGRALNLNRNSDGAAAVIYRSGTEVGSISVTTTATSFNTSSDYRLKENVVPLTGAADRLKLIPVHRFNFIADPDKTVDGFLAHEAQAVVPECVTGEKDAVDDDGNPIYQGIDQSKLVPLLTAALQETLAEIESLKARVTKLEP